MVEENKQLMIVSRVKSPPYMHKREILYQGRPIDVLDIPEIFSFTEEAKNYFYSVHRIKRTEQGCYVSYEGYIYDGSFEKDFHSRNTCVSLPFTEASKKGLIDFLNSL